MPNNNKKNRGSNQSNISQQSNPGVGHGNMGGGGGNNRGNQGNTNRGNQGMEDQGSNRRNEDMDTDNNTTDR